AKPDLTQAPLAGEKAVPALESTKTLPSVKTKDISKTPSIEKIPQKEGIVKEEKMTPVKEKFLEQVKTGAGQGFSKIQKDVFVGRLLEARDEILRSPEVGPPIPEGSTVPFLTQSEAKALGALYGTPAEATKASKSILEKNFEKFKELGLVTGKKGSAALTEMGRVAEIVNGTVATSAISKEGFVHIKIPGDGEFKILKNVNAINEMLKRLGVRSDAKPIARAPKEEAVQKFAKHAKEKIAKFKEEKPIAEIPEAKPVEQAAEKYIEALDNTDMNSKTLDELADKGIEGAVQGPSLVDAVKSRLAGEAGFVVIPEIPGEPIRAVQNIADSVGDIFTRYRNIDDLTREELIRYEEMIPKEIEDAANISFDMVAKRFDKASREAILKHMDNPGKYPLPEVGAFQ
ncbi:MAG: hypothetical protein QGI05_03985, partial [Candidatus Omnitrophota bacterium]|nr:hypothetical protein [Candidatus Omnitrophota bacterium]